MSARKVQKTLLGLAVSVAAYVVVAFAVDAALLFLLDIHGWPVQVVNAVIAVACGWKVSRWNDRQDELEEKRSEVDS